MHQTKHISVLYDEFLQYFPISTTKKNIIVDATLGMWGHARGILSQMKKWDIFIGFDADIRNLSIVQPLVTEDFAFKGIELHFIHDNFVHLKAKLEERDIHNITGIYYDLWLSSLHVDEWDRGFSFRYDAPLDMRFDTSHSLHATHVVNQYSQQELQEIFQNYGEEPASRKIAQEIVKKRREEKILTTGQLAKIIETVSPFPKTKMRIFQALRIEVNHELENLETSLTDAVQILTPGWYIFAISFHSLEDRIVKQILREDQKKLQKDTFGNTPKKEIELITKKPLVPTQEEIKKNPRAKSAKARCGKKI